MQYRRFHQCSHVFSFGRECQLIYHSRLVSQGNVIFSFAIQPQQQGNLRRISHPRRLSCLFFFQESRRIDCYTFCYHFLSTFIQLSIMYLHQILRQRTGLVCTNHRNGPHRFTRMHLTNQIIGFQHTTHIQSQTQCYTHW